MEIIADFLLLSATASACFYCYMLGERLKKFKSTRNGIASSLASLSKSVEDAQTTIAHAHLAAEQSVGRLGPLVDEARTYEEKLRNELSAVEAALDALLESRAQALQSLTSCETESAPHAREAEIGELGPKPDAPEDDAMKNDVATGDDGSSVFDVDVDGPDFEIEWNSQGKDASDKKRDVISLEADVA